MTLPPDILCIGAVLWDVIGRADAPLGLGLYRPQRRAFGLASMADRRRGKRRLGQRQLGRNLGWQETGLASRAGSRHARACLFEQQRRQAMVIAVCQSSPR